MKTCICAIAKMEELYIREWIEHHKNIDIDHIVIADNNESDYENPLQPIIQDYVNDGYVTILDYNNMKSIEYSVQLRYYNDMYKKYCDEYDWIFFIDIDEFIELPAYNNDIKLFLSDKKFKDKNAIMFYWQDYYNPYSLYYENKPLKERFPYIHNPFNNTISVKTCYNCNKFKNKLSSIHCSTTIDICDTKGNCNFIEYNKNFKNKNKFSSIIIEDNDCFNYAYIRHHKVKSCEEYIKYKCLRGRIAVKLKDYKIRYSLKKYIDYFKYDNLSEETLKDINTLFNEYCEMKK